MRLRFGIAASRTYADPKTEEMLLASIVFAAVIATVLLLTFERTRGFGIIGVFALIALQPWFFTPFFALIGALIIYLKRKGTI